MKPDRLEPISLEDIVFLGEYVNDLPQFGLHIGLPDAYDIDRIKSEVNLPKESKRLVVYKIVSDCKETLGYCYYRYFHLPKAALIAVVVLPQHKRLGIGTETLAFLVEEIKSDARQIERVESVVASVNTTSLKALLNYGFVVEGVQHRTFRRPNLVADSILLKFDLLEPNLEVSNDLYDLDNMNNSKIEIERLSEQAKIAIASEFASLPPKTLERILESKSALDLGCGDGSFIKYLHEHSPGIALTGVDISKSLAQFSQTACGKYANIINQDATDFLMTSGSEDYDLISMRYFIGHLPADQYSKIFAACRMRLKPNGILYIASVDPTYTRFHPRIPTFELAWFQKELHKKRSGGHWQAPPFIGENLATADFCSTQTFTRFFTTENLEPNKFASVIGRQLLWGSDPSWDSVMRQAAKELDEWALNRSGFAQTMIVIHIAEKK